MKIFVLSKHSFDKVMLNSNIKNDNVETFNKMFFISINDSCGTDEVPYFNKDYPNVKRLFFDDVDEDLESNGRVAKAFTIEQAKELISFIDNNRNRSSCVIHCAAGISRSGAVGQFINDFYGGVDFKETNRVIRPNNHVFRTLKNEFMERFK